MYAGAVDLGVPLPDVGAMIPIGNSRGEKSFVENYLEAVKIEKTEHDRWRFFLRRTADLGGMMAASHVLDASAPGQLGEAWNEAKVHLEYISGPGGASELKRLDYSELHRKLALCTLPFFMVVLGVGLGLLVKKSNRMIGFLLGLALYVLLYYPMTILAKSLSGSAKLSVSAQWPQYLPNVVFLLLGVILWRLYERGMISALPWLTALLSGLWNAIVASFWSIWGFCAMLVDLPSRLFRRTADRYVGQTFMTPLLIVILCIGGFYVVIDVVDHLNEIIDGVVHASDPNPGLPMRTSLEAVRDILAYYGIQALEITLEILPLEVLIAGMLCAMVLVRNQEHLILKSSGVRLQRAVRPMILLAFLMCVGVSAVRELWMPDLLMERDFLKPMIYHKGAPPDSFRNEPVRFDDADGQGSAHLPVGRRKKQTHSGRECGRGQVGRHEVAAVDRPGRARTDGATGLAHRPAESLEGQAHRAQTRRRSQSAHIDSGRFPVQDRRRTAADLRDGEGCGVERPAQGGDAQNTDGVLERAGRSEIHRRRAAGRERDAPERPAAHGRPESRALGGLVQARQRIRDGRAAVVVRDSGDVQRFEERGDRHRQRRVDRGGVLGHVHRGLQHGPRQPADSAVDRGRAARDFLHRRDMAVLFPDADVSGPTERLQRSPIPEPRA
jgi:lipopolysaccharide export LptBFGC system permease protein LptF